MRRLLLLFLAWLPLFVEAQNKILSIGTAEEFRTFAQNVNAGNDFTGRTIVLTANIDLGDEDWTPIGTTTYPFMGNFDGQGHWVVSINVNVEGRSTGDVAGLFGVIGEGAVVQNVGIESGLILLKSKSHEDNFCYVGGIAGQNYGTISQCANKAEVRGNWTHARVGGIAGMCEENFNGDYGLIEDCYNLGEVYTSKTSSADDNYLGGIVGWCDGTVRKVYVSAKISEAKRRGGIFGYIYTYSDDTFQCENAYYSEGDAYYDQDDNRCGESMLGFELDGKLNRRGDYTIWSFAEGRLPLLSQMTELLWGDVNLDGEVSIADVTYLVNIILGKARVNHMADVNRDGDVSIADVTALVNIILGRE